ncbi:MAG: paclitaxel/taxanoid biosynthesis susceptibility protein TS1, partial [Clostridiales bacterium]|nr:paclitaxel/taxanoid biosynthesis susceptibility protein TS1 [Clostridiales bacterium]
GGTIQTRCESLTIQQVRRNNRSLQKFYDARYIDTRTGEKASGQELNSGRRTRNKNHNTENLHKYHGHKVKKGQVSIRRQRYPLQPFDTVLYYGQRYLVKGVQNKGAYIKLDGLAKPVKTSVVKLLYYGKGLCVL